MGVIDRQMDRWMDGWMGRCIDGWMDRYRWMDGLIDRWTNRLVKVIFHSLLLMMELMMKIER
jgi:hypothetical protein